MINQYNSEKQNCHISDYRSIPFSSLRDCVLPQEKGEVKRPKESKGRQVMDNFIITIGCQYGSGGHEIGKLLAERAGCAYYDTPIMKKATKDIILSKSGMEQYNENLSEKWFGFIPPRGLGNPKRMPAAMRTQLAQFEVIRKIALEGSAVIVDQCADYILQQQKNVFTVFVYASENVRISNLKEMFHINEQDIAQRLQYADKFYTSFYCYYTGRHWGKSDHYHLCINSGLFGVEGSVQAIQNCIQLFPQIMC